MLAALQVSRPPAPSLFAVLPEVEDREALPRDPTSADLEDLLARVDCMTPAEKREVAAWLEKLIERHAERGEEIAAWCAGRK